MIQVIPRINDTRVHVAKFLQKHPPLSTDVEKFQFALSRILLDLPPTDADNSVRLASRFGHLIRYVAEQKAFFVWREKRWIEDRGCYVPGFAKTTANYIGIEAVHASERGEKERTAELWKHSRVSLSKRSLDSMVDLVKSEPGIFIEQGNLDQDNYLLNCNNGTLDLKSGKLFPHDPGNLITKLAPVDYDPEARCPHWEHFLMKVAMGNHNIVRFLQQLCGCGLVGEQLDDVLAVNFGPGGNGKTVFSEIIKCCLGDYASTATSDLFLSKSSEGISNDRACLVGVRFLTASETDDGRRLNEALVKGLTGGDVQRVRFLHKEFFDLYPKFTPLLFTNHKPIINGTDAGIWRRVKFIPWLWNFEADPDKKPKPVVMQELKSELSGILNWMIVGLVDRLRSVEIFVPDEVRGETDAYRRQSDTMGEFLEDYCVVGESDAEISKKDLYEKYKEFASGSGQSNISTEKGFSMKLRERSDIPYLGERRVARERRWIGIRLRGENEQEQIEEFF